MRIAAAVVIGCIITFCQNATSSPSEHRKKDLSGRDGCEEDAFTAVKPGSVIYFRAIRDGNLIVGPRLSSVEGVTVHVVGLARNVDSKPVRYSVLRSGVLVPKVDEIPGDSSCNRGVLKSLKPTFYVRGFKGILIPLGVLYPKTKQAEIVGDDSEAAALAAAGDESSSEESRCDECDEVEDDAPVGGSVKGFSSGAGTVFESRESSEVPEKTCNGEITLFVLQSDGVLRRMPADPYLPMGIQLSYTVKDNFIIKPKILDKSSDDPTVHYFVGKNGDLVPYADNEHTVRTEDGSLVSFLLGDSGSLIPVREERDGDRNISYYYDGELLFRGRQFPDIFSNSRFVLINNKRLGVHGGGRNDTAEGHRIRKRSLFPEEYIVKHPPPQQFPYYTQSGHLPALMSAARSVLPPAPNAVPIALPETAAVLVHRPPSSLPHHVAPPVYEQHIPPPAPRSDPYQMDHQEFASETVDPEDDAPPRMRIRTDLFAYDDKGIKIPLVPEITEQNDVVLYKLTCKGNLVRYPPCKEPEYGFQIHFQLLLDEFILVPVTMNNRPTHISYELQENGDLIPVEANENTFKKAPGSLIYFILGKNNILFPVQQKVDPDGGLTFFYQDYYLLKLPNTANKPLHFSTVSRPIFAYYNGLTIITLSSKPRLNPTRGSNWRNHSPSGARDETGIKDIFLSGPNDVLIRIAPYRTKTGGTVVYELDNNGILYRSPKDKKKCIILKTYNILKEGILVPSNETTGYMYMMSKNGDMFPYLYPDGKLEAPPGESLKYLLCEKGILLPMELEIVDNHLCYFFHDVVVYKERIYSKEDLDAEKTPLKLHHKDGCENPSKPYDRRYRSGVKPLTTPDGTVIYYEKMDKMLKRHPPDDVPNYLSYTMGSFELQPDGSLFQIRFQDPDEDVVNLMLEPNGDLLEDTRNRRSPHSAYYILDVNGNLISVEGRRTRKSIYFYKNHVKVCRVRLLDSRGNHKDSGKSDKDKSGTPLGRDPMKLMEDPEPKKDGIIGESQSLYIPIPLKSISMSDADGKGGKSTDCDKMKETMALELEINDEIIRDIKNWAAKCDKLLSRREVERSLTEALQGLNVAGLMQGAPAT